MIRLHIILTHCDFLDPTHYSPLSGITQKGIFSSQESISRRSEERIEFRWLRGLLSLKLEKVQNNIFFEL